MLKMIGAILIVDGLLSLIFPQDKNWLWQLGRIIRIFLGVYLIYYGN
jgi:hypothetical protein